MKMVRGNHTGKRFVIPQECQAYNSTGQGCHALVDDEEDTVDRRVPVWFQGHHPIYRRKRRRYTVEHQARAAQQLQTPPQRALSWQVLRLVVRRDHLFKPYATPIQTTKYTPVRN